MTARGNNSANGWLTNWLTPLSTVLVQKPPVHWLLNKLHKMCRIWIQRSRQATTLHAEQSTNHGLIESRGEFFYLLQNVQSGSGATTASNSMSTWSDYSGARVAEAWSWPLRASSVEGQTEGSDTSTPPSCLHGMNSDDFKYLHKFWYLHF